MARLIGTFLVVAVLVAGCGDDPERLSPTAGPDGRLTVHPVLGTTDDDVLTDPDRLDPSTESSVADPDGGAALVLGPAVLTRDDVAGATAESGSPDGPVDAVVVAWTPAGADRWSELTGQAACAPQDDPARRIAVLVDGVVLSAPVVGPAVACDVGIAGGTAQLSGPFTRAEAERLAASLQPASG